jgi:spheroidene monooxygenase
MVAGAPHGTAVAALVLAEFAPGSRTWGAGRLVLGGLPLRQVPGLRFAKVLGSGHEGGFGLRPSLSRQGLFCLFDDERAADRFLDASKVLAGYRAHAREFLTVKLRAFSSRGTWSGSGIPVSAAPPPCGPIAALTRASIRPAVALAFWRKSPPAERSLEAAEGCLLAVGLGEAPLLRQATFSLWDSVEHMDRYARSGAHLEAIRAAYAGRYFSESMFVRFVPSDLRGMWKGQRFG